MYDGMNQFCGFHWSVSFDGSSHDRPLSQTFHTYEIIMCISLQTYLCTAQQEGKEKICILKEGTFSMTRNSENIFESEGIANSGQ